MVFGYFSNLSLLLLKFSECCIDTEQDLDFYFHRKSLTPIRSEAESKPSVSKIYQNLHTSGLTVRFCDISFQKLKH